MTEVAEIETLVGNYRTWLKDRTTLKSVHSDWVEITTPFLDRHNDCIQIYVKKEEGGYKIIDDGYTIRDLEISGCSLDTPKRKSLLQGAARGFCVDISGDILSVKATPENFPQRKHALLQAILAINDLFYVSSTNVRSLFKEDVAEWLRSSEIRFLTDVQFTGVSGFLHTFDFGIPSSRQAPERLLNAINNPKKNAAENLIFSWLDTRGVRPDGSIAWAVLNDNEKQVSGAVIAALKQYDVEPFVWSERESVRHRLAA